MTHTNLFYTSINNYYLPKARVLAKSVKKYCPDVFFSLVLADQLPHDWNIENEPFDEVLQIKDIDVPVDNLDLWIYTHSVVELCTAIKGPALVHYLNTGYKNVIYLDPDIAVFHDLEPLYDILTKYDVVLTPHQTIPEKTDIGVIDNEICSLRYGVYNYGFYAVSNTDNGRSYANWWSKRLVDHCYDDIPSGLFTDQKWGDIVPCLFDNIKIWEHPGANVATWNISNREMSTRNEHIIVNEEPLLFYHFSGFDSGAFFSMSKKWGNNNDPLNYLREWYITSLDREGQQSVCKGDCCYDFYDNGEKVENWHRRILRDRNAVSSFFKNTNPYITAQEKSYYAWLKNEATLPHSHTDGTDYYKNQLDMIMSSRSYKLALKLKAIKNKIVGKKQ